MDKKIIRERIGELRNLMISEGISACLFPTADYHNSEYVSDFFKVREYFSGFSGSNGTLVVTQENAVLWTDGRYYIQAEKELAHTGISMYHLNEAGFPTVMEFLESCLQSGDVLSVDAKVVSYRYGQKLYQQMKEKNVSIDWDKDLVSPIWKDRPCIPEGRIFLLSKSVRGDDTSEKIKKIRTDIQKIGCQSLVMTKLDDIMWLFNIRGNDVSCNPVAMSYAIVTLDEVFLYLQEKSLNKEVREYLLSQKITLCNYQNFLPLKIEGKVLACEDEISYAVGRGIQHSAVLVHGISPATLWKARKTETEIENMRRIYLQDSAAVTKFIFWIKNTVKKNTIENLTEVDAAMYLDNLRRQIPDFLDFSFPTISAYKENAAMMHYEAKPESCKKLGEEGMLLVDSGGHYLGGTTDVTRTIALGEVSDEVKNHFTAVVSGMLRLASAHFLSGCTGRNLDILARALLWDQGIDYRCGTGHGVGYILNVHEGPQRISWKYNRDQEETLLEAGMTVTDEPGVYIEGSHGIRIENVLVCQRETENAYGKFLQFETLTFVPIDLEAIDTEKMSETDIQLLNLYHKKVYDKIAPYLTEPEKEWLFTATREIRRREKY